MSIARLITRLLSIKCGIALKSGSIPAEEEYSPMKTLRTIAAAGLLMLVAGMSPAFAQSKTTSAQEQANLKLVSDWWREVQIGRAHV